MNKNLFKFVIPGTILVIIIFIDSMQSNLTKGRTIDIKGSNGIVSASLNMRIGYNNELMIKLITAEEEFDPPSEIFIDIKAKGKSIHTNKLKKENDKYLDFGAYKETFNSIRKLEKNYTDVMVSVSFRG